MFRFVRALALLLIPASLALQAQVFQPTPSGGGGIKGKGPNVPTSCTTPGDLFFKTNAPDGQNVYGCNSNLVYVLQAGGGSSISGLNYRAGGFQASPNPAYALGDWITVVGQGSYYCASTPCTSAPTTGGDAHWKPIAENGTPGAPGVPGGNGADGKSVRHGSGAPTSLVGVDGDTYIDDTAHVLYGPKASGAWPSSGTSLVGQSGKDGADGKGELVQTFTFTSQSTWTISPGTGTGQHGCGSNPIHVDLYDDTGGVFFAKPVTDPITYTVTIPLSLPTTGKAVLRCATAQGTVGSSSAVTTGTAEPSALATNVGDRYIQTAISTRCTAANGCVWIATNVSGTTTSWIMVPSTAVVALNTGGGGGGGGGSMPTANLWHDWKLTQGAGGIGYADANTAAASDNLLTFGTGYFDAFPWNRNNITANSPADTARIQLAGGGSSVGTHNVTLTGGQPYTLTLKASSNASGVPQSARFLAYTGSFNYSSDFSYATTGSTHSYTFTPASTGAAQLFITADAAGDAADIEVTCFDLVAGSSSTGCNGAADYGWNMYLGEAGLPGVASAPSWHTGEGITFPSGNSTEYAYATGTPQAFSAISIYAAINNSAVGQYSNYATLLTSPDSNRSLTLGCADGQVSGSPVFYFGGTSLTPLGVNCLDGKSHIVTATYDGTTMLMYLDGLQVGSKTQSGLSISALKELFFGNLSGIAGYAGDIYDVRIFTAAHTASQVATNVPLYRTELAAHSITIPTMKVALLCEGDSIMAGIGANVNQANNCYLMRQQSAPYNFVQGNNTAVSGATLHGTGNTVDARIAGDDALKLAGGKNIFVLGVGTNDFPSNTGDVRTDTTAMDQYITDYLGTLTTRLTNGWDWAVGGTVIPRCYGNSADALYEANREYFNSHLLSRASGVSKVTIADYASASAFAYNGTATNPACSPGANYSGDGVHPSNQGYTAMSAVSQPIIATILSTINP